MALDTRISTRILQHLPDELTSLVVQQLGEDKKTLCNLARTCSRLQQLSEEQLYSTIRLLSVNNLHAIIEAFSRRSQRVRAVQTLEILYRFRQGELSGSLEARRAFNACVPQMVKLRHWHVESPYDNFKWEFGGEEWVEGDMERFREALETACLQGPEELQRVRELGRSFERTVGLAQLEKLTLHSHGSTSDFWNLDGFHCLFRHPSLRYLHASCFTLPKSIPELEPHVRSTPLTTLIFDECELDPSSLRQILCTPKALKNLTLGENVFNTNRSKSVEPKLTNSAGASLEALSAVAHSLERLTHYDPMSRTYTSTQKPCRIDPRGDGMREFHSLTFLDCDPCSFLYTAVVMNPTIAPPNLEVLRIRHQQLIVDLFDELPDVNHYTNLPSLKTLEFVQSSYWHSGLSSAEYICETERLRERHAYAYKLFKAGINMRVYIDMSLRPNLIPPFLFNEPTPILRCLYDAANVGFQRHILDGTEEANRIEVLHNGTVIHIDIPGPSPPGDHGNAYLTSNFKNGDKVPETDQLGFSDILRLRNECRRALHFVKAQFPPFTDSDEEDMFDFGSDDFDELDDDMDVEFELDEDFDGEYMTLDGLVHDHELYIEFQNQTEEGYTDDEEDEDEDEEFDDEDDFD